MCNNNFQIQTVSNLASSPNKTICNIPIHSFITECYKEMNLCLNGKPDDFVGNKIVSFEHKSDSTILTWL